MYTKIEQIFMPALPHPYTARFVCWFIGDGVSVGSVRMRLNGMHGEMLMLLSCKVLAFSLP